MLARTLLRDWAREFELDCSSGVTPRRVVLRVIRAHMPLPIYGRVLNEDDAAANRQLHCRAYNECLTFAVRNDWPGFVCTHCGSYDQMSRDEYFRDVDAMSDMLLRMAAVAFTAVEQERLRAGVPVEPVEGDE